MSRERKMMGNRVLQEMAKGLTPEIILQIGVENGTPNMIWTDYLLALARTDQGFMMMRMSNLDDPWQIDRCPTEKELTTFVEMKLNPTKDYKLTCFGLTRCYGSIPPTPARSSR